MLLSSWLRDIASSGLLISRPTLYSSHRTYDKSKDSHDCLSKATKESSSPKMARILITSLPINFDLSLWTYELSPWKIFLFHSTTYTLYYCISHLLTLHDSVPCSMPNPCKSLLWNSDLFLDSCRSKRLSNVLYISARSSVVGRLPLISAARR